MRGSDLSGSIQDAGGVGGVLAVNLGRSTLNLQPSTHCVSYDGNGNVVALHNAADGAESAAYEYGPFSEPIRVTGPVASLMPLRFSTMYEDNVTGDRKYLFRDYTPSTGRWKSRDPIEEEGGKALYAFVGNDPVIAWDLLGLDRMSLSQMEALLATSSERFYNQLVALCPKCPVEWTDERGNVQTCDPEVCRLTALVMMVDFSYYLRATFTSQYRRFGNVLAFTSWYDSETINDRADQGPGNGNMSEHYNAGYGLKCTGMQELMMTRFYAVTLPVRDRHSQCFKGALFHRLPVMLRRAAHNWFAIYGPLNNDPKKPDITVDPWYSAGGIISKQGSYGHVDEIKPKLW
jgi:RHS repeat-associated protein